MDGMAFLKKTVTISTFRRDPDPLAPLGSKKGLTDYLSGTRRTLLGRQEWPSTVRVTMPADTVGP